MLSINNITIHIRPGQVLHPISLEAKPGEIVAILGGDSPEGRALMKILSGEIQADSGFINYSEKFNPSGKNPRLLLFRNIFNRLNDHETIRGKVNELIALYVHNWKNCSEKMSRTLAEQFIALAGIGYLKNRLVDSLSKTERTKVRMTLTIADLICRKQMKNHCLLLDSSFNQLEMLDKHRMLQVVNEFCAAGNMVIAAINDANLVASYADKVLLLKKGKQFAFGPVNEVITTDVLSRFLEEPIAVVRYPMNDRPIIQLPSGNSSDIKTPESEILASEINESNGMQRIYMLIDHGGNNKTNFRI